MNRSIAEPRAVAPSRRSLDEETACLIALAMIEGVGPKCLDQCRGEVGAVAAWEALVVGAIDRCEPLARRLRGDARAVAVAAARTIDPGSVLAEYRARGIRVFVRGRRGYPARLADDLEPPAVVFATGPVPEPSVPTVAIVGTRNATTLGRTFARRLGADLTAVGICVVSGLALGIDGAAHRGAVDVLAAPLEHERGTPGAPLGVIASGLDIAYPARHERLHREVASHGTLLSETPLGRRPSAWRFPARNRIIAGLSDAVVVVESRATGGSMLTADEALERDVPVLAVPGHPSSPAAAGTNSLIFDGARLLRDVDDVLDALGLDIPCPPAVPEATGSAGPVLPALQRRLLDSLGAGPLALAELVAVGGNAVDDVSAALTALEMSGHVVSNGGWYEPALPVRRMVGR